MMRDDLFRDLHQTPGETIDPTRAARVSMRGPLPKRFYETAAVEERDGGFALVLDGKPAKTPARNPLVLPTRASGEAVAQEWAAQGEHVDPATMPLTRITNSAIDGVAGQMEAVRDEVVKYAGSDLVCYRADAPDRLVLAQAKAWNPVLAFVRERLGASFELSEGVVFVEQPAEAIEAVRARVARETSPWRLAALHVITTLSGSALIALALADGGLDAEAAWAAAHVDEHDNESIWGEDLEASRRRAVRAADFMAAARLYALT